MEVEYKIIKRIVREGVFYKFFSKEMGESITASVGGTSVKLIITSIPRTSDCMRSLSVEYYRYYHLSIDGVGVDGVGSARVKNALDYLISKSIQESKIKQREVIDKFTEAR